MSTKTLRRLVPLTASMALTLAALGVFLWLGWSAASGIAGTIFVYSLTLGLIEQGLGRSWPIRVLRVLLPETVAQALHSQVVRRENSLIETSLRKMLEAHGLTESPKRATAGCAAALSLDDSRADRVRAATECIAKELPPPISPSILELLFYEWEAEVPGNLWPPDGGFQELAQVLFQRSSWLAPWRERLDLQASDVEWLLERMKKSRFRIGDLTESLHRCEDLWKRETAFLKFLIDNDLAEPSDWVPVIESLQRIERVQAGKDPLLTNTAVQDLEPKDQVHLLALLELAKKVLERSSDPLSPDELERRSLLAIIVFSVRTYAATTIRPCACHLLAENGSTDSKSPWRRGGVQLAWSYLAVNEAFRNGFWECSKPFVCLDSFFDEWRDWVQERMVNPGAQLDLERELSPLYYALLKGKWLPSRDDLLRRVYVWQLQTAIEKPPVSDGRPPVVGSLLGHFPEVDSSLREIAGGIDLSTVERYIGTREVTPYLITLGPSAGPLPRLLDCLTKAGKRKSLKAANVDFATSDGHQKYNFRQYTPYTRVGLVPRGMPFTQFARGFREDVAKLIANQTQVLEATKEDPVGEYYEILVHAFNPAAFNPLGFGRPRREGGSIQRIKELFAEHLEPDELLSLLVYAGLPGRPEASRLREALFEIPLLEPDAPEMEDLTDEERNALATRQERIKEDFLAELGLQEHGDERELLLRLEGSEAEKKETIQALAQAIARHVGTLSAKPKRASELAQRFLERVRRMGRDLVSLELILGRSVLIAGRESSEIEPRPQVAVEPLAAAAAPA